MPAGTVTVQGGTTVTAGTSLRVTLTGWAPREQVRVTVGSTTVTTTVDATGRGTATVAIPGRTTAGDYRLTGTSVTTGATSAAVTVHVLARPWWLQLICSVVPWAPFCR